MNYGRGRAVGRDLGVGVTLGGAVGVDVAVGVTVGVDVALGVGVGGGSWGTMANARSSPLCIPVPTMTPSSLIPSAEDEVFMDKSHPEF